jgi:hypothetical protein
MGCSIDPRPPLLTARHYLVLVTANRAHLSTDLQIPQRLRFPQLLGGYLGAPEIGWLRFGSTRGARLLYKLRSHLNL